MKLVPENINEAVKHLPGRSEEEVNSYLSEIEKEILSLKNERSIRHAVYDEIVRRGFRISWDKLTEQLYQALNIYISEEDRKLAIKKILRVYTK